MGDLFLTYDESGKAYFHRLFYLVIIGYIIAGIIAGFYFVDIIFFVFGMALIAIITILYVIYFIMKNPPIESNIA